MNKNIIAAALCICALNTQAKDNPKNSLSVIPVSVTQHTATGIGLQYERLIGNKLSITLPASYTFGNSNPCDETVRTNMGYVNPGVKYYPSGANRTVNYAIGVSAMLGKGNSNCCSDMNPTLSEDPNTNADAQTLTEKKFTPLRETGVLLMNSVQINISDRLFAGGDAAVGAAFSQYATRQYWDAAFQFNIRLGYKF